MKNKLGIKVSYIHRYDSYDVRKLICICINLMCTIVPAIGILIYYIIILSTKQLKIKVIIDKKKTIEISGY